MGRILIMRYVIRCEFRVPLDDDACASSRAIENCFRSIAGQPFIDPESVRFEIEPRENERG